MVLYIGSGPIREMVLSDPDLQGISAVVWGRRLKNTRWRDFTACKGRPVVFLDTIDMESISTAAAVVRFTWAISPYRIEKKLHRFLLKLFFGRNLVVLHIPAIADSFAWQQQRIDSMQTESAVIMPAITYLHVVALVRYALSQQCGEYIRITSRDVWRWALDSELGVASVGVLQSAASRLVVVSSEKIISRG